MAAVKTRSKTKAPKSKAAGKSRATQRALPSPCDGNTKDVKAETEGRAGAEAAAPDNQQQPSTRARTCDQCKEALSSGIRPT